MNYQGEVLFLTLCKRGNHWRLGCESHPMAWPGLCPHPQEGPVSVQRSENENIRVSWSLPRSIFHQGFSSRPVVSSLISHFLIN